MWLILFLKQNNNKDKAGGKIFLKEERKIQPHKKTQFEEVFSHFGTDNPRNTLRRLQYRFE